MLYILSVVFLSVDALYRIAGGRPILSTQSFFFETTVPCRVSSTM